MKRIPRPVLLKMLTLCAVLVIVGLVWRDALMRGEFPAPPQDGRSRLLPTLYHPFFEFVKLIAAFFVGLTITVVHRLAGHSPTFSPSMERAQILLCVSGALMMIIIGDSLARAFGIAGAASIIRFRTPVDDPQDTIVLFLALGLGMACGLGAFGIAGLGTAFICGALMYLATDPPTAPRNMTLRLTAPAGFRSERAQQILERHGIAFVPQEIVHNESTLAVYTVTIHPELPIDVVSQELRTSSQDGPVVVQWEAGKKKKS